MFGFLRKVAMPFRRLSDVINRLPLAGKLLLRPVLLSVYTAPQSEKFHSIFIALVVLVLMIAGHYWQLILGWNVYIESHSILCKAIGLSFSIVNALVVYSQTILSLRVVWQIWSPPRRNIIRWVPKSYSFEYQMFCLAITLAGQFIFALAR